MRFLHCLVALVSLFSLLVESAISRDFGSTSEAGVLPAIVVVFYSESSCKCKMLETLKTGCWQGEDINNNEPDGVHRAWVKQGENNVARMQFSSPSTEDGACTLYPAETPNKCKNPSTKNCEASAALTVIYYGPYSSDSEFYLDWAQRGSGDMAVIDATVGQHTVTQSDEVACTEDRACISFWWRLHLDESTTSQTLRTRWRAFECSKCGLDTPPPQ